MALAWPRGEQQQQPSIRAGEDLVALGRLDLDQQPAAAGNALAGGARDLDLASDDQHPRPLVHLVVGESLACAQIERNRARLRSRGEDLGQTRLEVEARDVPALHGRLLLRGRATVALTLTHRKLRRQLAVSSRANGGQTLGQDRERRSPSCHSVRLCRYPGGSTPSRRSITSSHSSADLKWRSEASRSANTSASSRASSCASPSRAALRASGERSSSA